MTGASRGIGAAVARGLGANSARVAVHYRTGREPAEAVANEIRRAGGTAALLQGDIAEPGVAERLVDEAAGTFGGLDVLINNASDLISRQGVAETPDELFEQHVALNMRPVFTACRSAVRRFQEHGRGGAIVNVTSIAARTGGGGGSSLYASAKAFVATFTRALAKEVAADGIRVNAVSPGVIETDMQYRVTSPEQIEAALGKIPMGRLGQPDDCVGTFLYLCSGTLSGYVTGQIVEVNGGQLTP